MFFFLKSEVYSKILFCLVFILNAFHTPIQTNAQVNSDRSVKRCWSAQLNSTDLPAGYNALFAGSGECLLCHNSMTDEQGNPLGILDDWRSTMMANAGKDPLWRAKVSHESLVNPSHKEALEDICTRCHAPLGNFDAHHLGQEYYCIAEMVNDSLALDGVSCTLCHQITEGTFGSYSGNLTVGTSKQIWGPYPDPFTPPMINQTGYTPTYGNHIRGAALCGSCHTLITNSVDLNGEPTGTTFVEQAIYHEWLNSDYPNSGMTCQTCHIPEVGDTVKISTMPPWLDGRSPFGIHYLTGANVFMQNILKDNIEELGITAETVQFDSTISQTIKLLEDASVDLELVEMERTTDTLGFKVELKNLAGHKLPAGFPSRRIFIEMLLLNEEGDTIFHSGKMDDDFNLVNEDEEYEPHHEMINSEEQVQIYEMVMGDVEDNVTTVLERAYTHLKDNRIPPAGFLTTHPSYDTVEIAGQALIDPDFNREGETEGVGGDVVVVHAPIDNETGPIQIIARVRYQTVSPRWLSDMFGYTSDEIDLWETIYNAADRHPIIIKEDTLVSLPTKAFENLIDPIIIYPNPTHGKIRIDYASHKLKGVEIYGVNGTKIKNFVPAKDQEVFDLRGDKGLYLVKVVLEDNSNFTKRVIIY